jgi:tetratricopeptide (TPR) repeat protein
MTLMLSVACINQGLYEEARKWSDKAYEKRELMPQRLKILINKNHAFFYETPIEEIKYLRQLLEIDDKFPGSYYDIGLNYSGMLQYENAIPEFEKALELYKELDMKPWWIYNYTELGYAYHNTGRYKKEKKLYIKAEKDFPRESNLTWRQTILYLTIGDTSMANKYLKKYKSIYVENAWSEAAFERNLGWGYTQAGMLDKAEESFRKSVSLDNKNAFWTYYLAYFMIDQERNINEGLELIDKTLELSKGEYQWIFLDCKGWGLYKQGKYGEALDILQKSWDLRRSKAQYSHQAYLHLEAAKKAVANQKIN